MRSRFNTISGSEKDIVTSKSCDRVNDASNELMTCSRNDLSTLKRSQDAARSRNNNSIESQGTRKRVNVNGSQTYRDGSVSPHNEQVDSQGRHSYDFSKVKMVTGETS